MDNIDKMTVSEALEVQRQIEAHAKVAYELAFKEARIQEMSFDVFCEVFSMGFFMASRLIDIASNKN